jgi:serine/threonine protein kinase
MNGADQMSGGPKCPQCGVNLPAGTLAGLCPACLLKQATAESATQPEAPAFEPPSLAEVARLFPSLEILELLGKGGMGAVYKARQPALDRFVALKILPQQVGAGPGFTDRFTREARALARLNHPNIIGVYEFGQVNGLHYFIMEYVDGASLRQLEKAARLSPRDGLQIVLQICEALQYAHDEGVVHRDIKPENILVDRKGRVKIADFGLAKILGREPADLRLTGEGQVMGTPHYMAPEQVEHPLEVDHRADIYALGVVFYEMLTGELPLGKFASPSRKVQIDVRLDEVVLRSLEKEPELRYQQASEVKSHLQTIAGNAPVPDKTAPSLSSETHAEKKSQSLWQWLAGYATRSSEPRPGQMPVPLWRRLVAYSMFAAMVFSIIYLVIALIYWTLKVPEEPPEKGNPQRSVMGLPPQPLPAEKTTIVTVAPFLGKLSENTVEFLALSHLPAAKLVWWKPNGSSLGNPDFRINPDELAALPQVDSHLFVFRMQRSGTNSEAPAYSIDLARLVPEFTGIQMKRAQNLKGDGEVWWIPVPLQTNIDFTKVKLSFPVGNWYEIARAKADVSTWTQYHWPGESDRQIKFKEVNQDGADLSVIMTRLEDEPWWTLRLRAVDTNGVEHPELYATTSGKTNEYYTWRYGFKDCNVSRSVLALSQIKEFLLQARRVETVEFRNVSLQAGKTSKVQISERDAPVWSKGGEMPPSIPRKTSSDQLKPIPPEVIAKRQAIKDLSRLFPGPLTNDETRLAMEKELGERSRAFNASLAGTIAEPLILERDELMRKRSKVYFARDVEKENDLTKQILALSEKIGVLVDDAEQKLRATNGIK